MTVEFLQIVKEKKKKKTVSFLRSEMFLNCIL